MAVKAVLHRLVVKPIELETYDDAYAKAKEIGLEIPKLESNKYDHTQIDQGHVVDVGPTAFLDYVKRHNLPVPVKLGSLVTYARHSGKHVKDGETELVVINDDDVIAIHVEE